MSEAQAAFRTATELALLHPNPAVRSGAQKAAALFADYDALLARCEAAEARLAEAERLLKAVGHNA